MAYTCPKHGSNKSYRLQNGRMSCAEIVSACCPKHGELQVDDIETYGKSCTHGGCEKQIVVSLCGQPLLQAVEVP